MSEIETTLSDIRLFLQSLKTDLPEVFAKDAPAADQQGKILYMGDFYDADITVDAEAEPSVKYDADTYKFLVTIKNEDDDASDMVETWLREEAGRVLKERSAAWAAKMGVEFNTIFIKDQRTMWGSCSENKNINFSYRIIKMPNVIIDYLIVHELAHLVHMNHAQEYWALVEQHCPDYDSHRKWLNSNRAHIMANTKITYVKPQENTAEQPSAAAEEPQAAAEGEEHEVKPETV
ncbi:putative metal-dependent hydrolase [Elusimicrobium simillimum]|uniref:M48 family metallopeptidase n=1 Tax=Elusimicrobium simillimum TaxID=3143438 RepID=UPI003C6EE02F